MYSAANYNYKIKHNMPPTNFQSRVTFTVQIKCQHFNIYMISLITQTLNKHNFCSYKTEYYFK